MKYVYHLTFRPFGFIGCAIVCVAGVHTYGWGFLLFAAALLSEFKKEAKGS